MPVNLNYTEKLRTLIIINRIKEKGKNRCLHFHVPVERNGRYGHCGSEHVDGL